MEKKRYIKQAFKLYKQDKKHTKGSICFFIRGIDYTREHVRKSTPNGIENEIISNIAQDEERKKRVEIVERTLFYYQLDESPKADFILCRWGKGLSIVRASIECYISETTANRWILEIYDRATAVADLYRLW